MHALAHRRFLKMNGLGNEITVLDLRGSDAIVDAYSARAIAAFPRARFDQLMVLHDPEKPETDARVRIFNADGSEVGACGNGTRCVAWAMTSDPVMARPRSGDANGKNRLVLDIASRLVGCTQESDLSFTIDMGAPKLRWDEIPLAKPFEDTTTIDMAIRPPGSPVLLESPSAVSMGNPHAIFWVEDETAYDLATLGPQLEHHALFPERANISLARIAGRDHIVLRVWERGAGLTQACGTAACAALVAAVRKEFTEHKARVSLPGGDLVIEWRKKDNTVLMTGPVELEWEDNLPDSLFTGAER